MTMSEKTNKKQLINNQDAPKFKSFDIIHEVYQQALKNADDIMGIVTEFRKLLQNPKIIAKIPDDEKDSFFVFRSYVNNCYYERKSTFKLTNLISDVLVVILYIVIYYNNTSESPHVDMNINSRRKSLKRDCAKMLRKAYNKSNDSDTCGVKDRFGLRGILLNKNLSSDKNIELLMKITTLIFGILTDTTEKKSEFLEWIQNNNFIDDFTKLRLEQTLSLPFQADRYKDYINNPKENEYQSIHFTLVLPHYSPVCPGAILDFQFRNSEMHSIAEYGSASHNTYEEETKSYTDVFKVDDFSQIHIMGFDENEDIDGINTSKAISNRRVSATLVP